MRHISLIALYVGLTNLLGKRAAVLGKFPSGTASILTLTARRDAMSKLPAVSAGRALADELSTADDNHDAIGYAIWHFVEAYLEHPTTPANIVAAAKKVRAAFVPTLEDLVASYAAEAKAAIDKTPALTGLATELALFPVVGGQTLHQWAEDFVASGSKIDELLAARADMEQNNRKAAATLRVEVIGILNRLRKNLALEMKDDPSLPRELEGQVFGYLDMLEKTCADARAKGAEVEQIPPPPETPSGTTP
jgi:hypothetical protein